MSETGKKIALGLLSLLSLPISLYLSYWMLSQLNPDRLVWFLFIMNIPILIVIQILSSLIKKE